MASQSQAQRGDASGQPVAFAWYQEVVPAESIDRVVLSDFGLARMQERSGISGDSIAGTASYMAPEQAWGDIQGKSVIESITILEGHL